MLKYEESQWMKYIDWRIELVGGILRVSRLQKIKNEVTRKWLGHKIMFLQKIQEGWLRWFGEGSKMDPKRILYMAIHTRVQGTSSRRWPRMHWIDIVTNDIKQKGLKVNKAVKLAQDRKWWKDIIWPHNCSWAEGWEPKKKKIFLLQSA